MKLRLSPATLIGYISIAFGLGIIILTFFPVVKTEISYQLNKPQIKANQPITPVNTDFGIVIPKINANAAVIANVNPFDLPIYQKALSRGVAHAKGTALPGEVGNIFIFSHSSTDFLTANRYNSIFYLLSKLETGDSVKIYFHQQEHDYTVTSKNVVSSKAISYLNPKADEETLTLMTCWPPGTSIKRLIVQAKRSNP